MAKLVGYFNRGWQLTGFIPSPLIAIFKCDDDYRCVYPARNVIRLVDEDTHQGFINRPSFINVSMVDGTVSKDAPEYHIGAVGSVTDLSAVLMGDHGILIGTRKHVAEEMAKLSFADSEVTERVSEYIHQLNDVVDVAEPRRNDGPFAAFLRRLNC